MKDDVFRFRAVNHAADQLRGLTMAEQLEAVELAMTEEDLRDFVTRLQFRVQDHDEDYIGTLLDGVKYE